MIRTKAENTRLWQAGAFGNRIPVWDALGDVPDHVPGGVTVRCTVPGARWCAYNVPRADLEERVREFTADGAPPGSLYFSGTLPDREVLQGEWDGLTLTYGLGRGKFRQAIRQNRQAFGPAARLLMKAAMDPASYDDLLALEEAWPGHVVEFTVYDTDVGDLRGRNTMFWEVRRY